MSAIFHSDCLEALRKMKADTFDSLVTDPPAGISFMGKEWDDDKGGRDQWIAWLTEVMRECYRVMKPGAHGLVWALPRTSHWTATALENAGFEVRDRVQHIFGTGFPKSLDVSKAIDKAAGVEGPIVGKNPAFRERQLEHDANWETAMRPAHKRGPGSEDAKQWEGWGTALKPACEDWFLIHKPKEFPKWLENVPSVGNSLSPTPAALSAVTGRLVQVSATMQRAALAIENTLQSGKAENGSEVTDTLLSALSEAATDLSTVWSWNNTSGGDLDVAKTCITLMELKRTIDSKISSYLASLSTPNDITLSPNAEDYWLIRKPLSEKTVAANVLKYGTGALNIDASRVVTSAADAKAMERCNTPGSGRNKVHMATEGSVGRPSVSGVMDTTQGRFPSHLVLGCACSTDVHDEACAVRVLDEQAKQEASRFFYCAKASKADKGADNKHPTVKSTKLMEYLIRLITPLGGMVLDPFMGSGSTGVAALRLGFRFVGIEHEKCSVRTAKRRIGAIT